MAIGQQFPRRSGIHRQWASRILGRQIHWRTELAALRKPAGLFAFRGRRGRTAAGVGLDPEGIRATLERQLVAAALQFEAAAIEVGALHRFQRIELVGGELPLATFVLRLLLGLAFGLLGLLTHALLLRATHLCAIIVGGRMTAATRRCSATSGAGAAANGRRIAEARTRARPRGDLAADSAARRIALALRRVTTLGPGGAPLDLGAGRTIPVERPGAGSLRRAHEGQRQQRHSNSTKEPNHRLPPMTPTLRGRCHPEMIIDRTSGPDEPP